MMPISARVVRLIGATTGASVVAAVVGFAIERHFLPKPLEVPPPP